MRDYEIVYIFKSSFMPEEIEQKLEKYHAVLTGDGGEITAVEQWGKRQLAYPIRKESNGYYVIAQFTGQPAALPEFERRLKLDEDLLRHLIVISEGELPKPAASLEHAEGRTLPPTESADADKGAESADKGADSADGEADSESEESAPDASESAADEAEEAEEVAAEDDSAADVEELAEGETAAEPIAESEEEVAPADDDAEVEPAGDEEKES